MLIEIYLFNIRGCIVSVSILRGFCQDYPETIRIVSEYYQLIGLLSERPIRPILRKSECYTIFFYSTSLSNTKLPATSPGQP